MENTLQSERIIAVDILRGIALLGILLAHFIYWHTGGPLPQRVYTENYGVGSMVATTINSLFIFGKFFAFFAFLFGVSFHLQMQSLDKRGTNASARFAKRLFILLIIGLVHHAFWMGDILSIYATLGFSLLFFKNLKDRYLLITAIVLILALPNKVWDAVNFLFFEAKNNDPFGNISEQYYEVVRSGGIWDILKFNVSQLAGKANFQLSGGRASITIGFFLLGMWASRHSLFNGTETSKLLLKKILKKSSIWSGAILTVLIGLVSANEIIKLGWQENPVMIFIFGALFDFFNGALVLVMITGISVLLYRKSWSKRFNSFSYIGKLALTSYLMQTVIGLMLFYGIGFGLFLKTTPGWNYMIGIGVFIIQVFAAKWWLKRFAYGPVEWLWRSATLGKWQVFKKQPNEQITTLHQV